MDPTRFDQLTKALASATSRRQALRRIGGILGGTVLAGVFPGLASASNSACAHFCNAVFGADTPAANQCISDAAHGKGLCHQCGNAAPSSICCTRNSRGFCSSYNGAHCPCDSSQCLQCNSASGTCVSTCSPGQTCQNGTCGATCPQGCIVLSNGTVACSCSTNADCNCGVQFCGSDVSLGLAGVCTANFNSTNACSADTDCAIGYYCNGGGFCTPACSCPSCFTAGTLVAMADGTSRSIEHVLVGDRVLGQNGSINRVVEIERPLLGHRHLYALNGSNFFVTAEHPFMTEEGWKSIDPAALAAEHSVLRVDRLAVGDRLLTLAAVAIPVGAGGSINAEAVDARVEAVALHSLVGQSADPATQLYNLRLDGDHTYFANGLLVHNK